MLARFAFRWSTRPFSAQGTVIRVAHLAKAIPRCSAAPGSGEAGNPQHLALRQFETLPQGPRIQHFWAGSPAARVQATGEGCLEVWQHIAGTLKPSAQASLLEGRRIAPKGPSAKRYRSPCSVVARGREFQQFPSGIRNATDRSKTLRAARGVRDLPAMWLVLRTGAARATSGNTRPLGNRR